ncbi:hypothetical protein [Paenibacillus tepidiphilus]|uniref:hypothetical protein n=1 Tax=Paenibacillus tepidiphilus TaxID=2608683 RepID=UPI0012399F25|nr:hypothetical protein [Paenibacillus tepidiphilus]
MNTFAVLRKIVLALIPSTLLLLILWRYFPNTGLGLILAIPVAYVVNIAIFLTGNYFSRRFNNAYIWGAAIVLSLIISIWLYPQDSGANVVILIFEKIFAAD